MPSILIIVAGTIEITTLVASVVVNMFIVCVTVQSWVKNKMLKISDQLIYGISTSNLLNGVLSILINTCILLQIKQDPTENILQLLLTNTMYSSIWFSTGLGVHYCLKIVNLKQRLYISLQHGFPKMFPRIYTTLVMGFIIVSCPCFVVDVAEKWSWSTTDSTQNVSLSRVLKISSLYSSLSFLAVSSVPFIIFLCSTSLIIISLYRHVKRMEHNPGVRSPNMEVHVRAAKTVTCLLATHVLYFISLLIVLPLEKNTNAQILFILIAICYFLCSLILIRANNQLEKTLKGLFYCFSCCRTSENPPTM